MLSQTNTVSDLFIQVASLPSLALATFSSVCVSIVPFMTFDITNHGSFIRCHQWCPLHESNVDYYSVAPIALCDGISGKEH